MVISIAEELEGEVNQQESAFGQCLVGDDKISIVFKSFF